MILSNQTFASTLENAISDLVHSCFPKYVLKVILSFMGSIANSLNSYRDST